MWGRLSSPALFCYRLGLVVNWWCVIDFVYLCSSEPVDVDLQAEVFNESYEWLESCDGWYREPDTFDDGDGSGLGRGDGSCYGSGDGSGWYFFDGLFDHVGGGG